MRTTCKNIAQRFPGVTASSSRSLIGHIGKTMLGSPADQDFVKVMLAKSPRSLMIRSNGFAVYGRGVVGSTMMNAKNIQDIVPDMKAQSQ
jgi:hypothetical protein